MLCHFVIQQAAAGLVPSSKQCSILLQQLVCVCVWGVHTTWVVLCGVDLQHVVHVA